MAISETECQRLGAIARNVRRTVIELASRKMVHIGAALSVADVLVALYFSRLRVRAGSPDWPERDRVILSKGHAALALYAVLGELAMIPREAFDRFGEPGDILTGHPTDSIPGVEVATGSLGHGLSVGAGLALAAALDRATQRVVVVLGDGELGEGSVWEAAAFAAHRRLTRLTAIVDRNGLQQEGPTARVLDLEPIADKWRSFGWRAIEADGHDFRELDAALEEALDPEASQPAVIIARTTKGKGVSFMENDPKWHMAWLRGTMWATASRELQ